MPRTRRAALDRAIAGIIVLWGWRRLAVAFVAGALSALALAPFFILPLLFVTLPVLVWLLDGAAVRLTAGSGARLAIARTAFAIGWWFGFGYFLAGLYWVGFALLVDAERYAWAMPLALFALPAGLALFPALAAAVARLLWSGGYRRVIVLAAAWTAAEWLRSVVLTGFPWNLIGQSLAVSDPLIQPAAYTGDLGLSVIVFLIAGAPATLADPARRDSVPRRWLPTLVSVVALAAIWFAGGQRIAAVPPGVVPGVSLRIVQANVDQAAKWDPKSRSQTVALYLEMSDSATSPQSMGMGHVTHLVWPETALPVLLANEPRVIAQIAALLPERSHLITGALRAEPAGGGAGARFFNSVMVIDDAGSITSVYDKRRLVPFGEFLPFQDRLEALGILQLTGVVGGFTAGAGPREPMRAGAVPRFAPLICYEIVFADLFAHDARPGWLVNVTNDAWFGDTSGPWQHLVQARLRAVEQGLPVVRAANSGISAVIDPYGRVTSLLPYGRRGVLDASLPAPLEPTVYAGLGRLPVLLFLVIVLAGACIFKALGRDGISGR